MPITTFDRLNALEEAVLQLEGAQYALHDIIANVLAKTPADDVEAMVVALADQITVHAEKIGAIRLTGYTEEIRSVADEAKRYRSQAGGLFARLTRPRS
jgi:hypothetical protein